MLTFNVCAKDVDVQPSCAVEVDLSFSADESQILDHFNLYDIVDHFSADRLLDIIGKDRAKDYFDLVDEG